MLGHCSAMHNNMFKQPIRWCIQSCIVSYELTNCPLSVICWQFARKTECLNNNNAKKTSWFKGHSKFTLRCSLSMLSQKHICIVKLCTGSIPKWQLNDKGFLHFSLLFWFVSTPQFGLSFTKTKTKLKTWNRSFQTIQMAPAARYQFAVLQIISSLKWLSNL